MTQPSTPAFFLQISKRRNVRHQIFPSANLHLHEPSRSFVMCSGVWDHPRKQDRREESSPRRFLNFQPFSFASWPPVFLSSSSLQSFLQSSSERGNVLGFTMFRKARTRTAQASRESAMTSRKPKLNAMLAVKLQSVSK